MIKSDLIQRVAAQNPHLYQRDVEKIVSAIFDEIVEALRRGDRVELRGFGAFSTKLRGPRQGHSGVRDSHHVLDVSGIGWTGADIAD